MFLDPLMGSELRVSIGTLLLIYGVVSLLFIPRGWRLAHSGIVILIFLSLFVLIRKESDILLDMIQFPKTITVNAIIRRTDSQYKFPYRIKVDASVDAPMEAAKQIVEKALTDAGATLLGFGTFLSTNDDNPKDNYASFLFGNDKFKRVEVIFSRLDQSKTRVVIRANKSFLV
ncbi:MAG: hypothetical protein PHZ00_03030 [Candidatus Peribacteraceae bacterium]|nr:hypothetical protein [Candidatus Peribacteraceae bacterium]